MKTYENRRDPKYDKSSGATHHGPVGTVDVTLVNEESSAVRKVLASQSWILDWKTAGLATSSVCIGVLRMTYCRSLDTKTFDTQASTYILADVGAWAARKLDCCLIHLQGVALDSSGSS